MANVPKGDNLAEAHVGVGKISTTHSKCLGPFIAINFSLGSLVHYSYMKACWILPNPKRYARFSPAHDAAVGIESCRFVYRQEQDLDL